MKIQYIGTGAAEGFPGMFCRCDACLRARKAGGRNLKTRSSILINDHILIDLSPDLYAQSLKFQLDLSEVTDLLITHTHSDHLTPFSLALRARDGATILPGVADADNYLSIYGSGDTGRAVTAALADQPHADAARLRFVQLAKGQWQQVGELSVYPLRANHKPDELCFIYVISDGHRHLLYANDTGSLSLETRSQIKQLGLSFDIVSMDTARGTLKGDGHMGIAENMELQQWLKANNCVSADTMYYLTHLSHMSGITHDELEMMMSPKGFHVAYDGMIIEE